MYYILLSKQRHDKRQQPQTQKKQPHSLITTQILNHLSLGLCVVHNKQAGKQKRGDRNAFFKTFFGLIIRRTVWRMRPASHFAGKLSRLRVRSRFPFTVYFCAAPRCASSYSARTCGRVYTKSY